MKEKIRFRISSKILSEKKSSFHWRRIKSAIIDKSSENVSVGRTEFDSPEIDNIVHIKGKAEVGNFVNVKIQHSE